MSQAMRCGGFRPYDSALMSLVPTRQCTLRLAARSGAITPKTRPNHAANRTNERLEDKLLGQLFIQGGVREPIDSDRTSHWDQPTASKIGLVRCSASTRRRHQCAQCTAACSDRLRGNNSVTRFTAATRADKRTSAKRRGDVVQIVRANSHS